MSAEDLNRLIQVFLYSSRQFHRLANVNEKDPEATVSMKRYAQRKLKQRHSHTEMCTKILQDVVTAKLPLTPNEQIAFIQLSFFKDLPDVTSYYESVPDLLEPEPLEYRKFDYEAYTELKKALPKGSTGAKSDLLLMNLAARNDQFDIIEEIWNGEDYISGTGVMVLLNYFQCDLKKPDALTNLTRTIQEIIQLKSVKSGIIDEVIALLIRLGKVQSAQELIQAAYYPNPNDFSKKWWISSSEQDYYHWNRAIYSRLTAITKDYEIIPEIYPSVKTFLSLVEYYSYNESSSFSQVRSVLKFMSQTTDIPTTHVFYKVIVKGFDIHSKTGTGDWTIDNLLEITEEIIDEVRPNSQQAIMELIKIGDMKSIQEEQLIKNPNENIWISTNFLNVILHTYISTLGSYYKSTGESRYRNAIHEVEELIRQHTTRVYHDSNRRNHRSVTLVEDITETKKAYLIELINIVSDIISSEPEYNREN
ncbi:hypothetical protein JA1_001679 [Spathaspora sp. JA1]|nr:hypothetical protein JA1_001679 [Spathaspora sp. JA1]